MRLAIIADIHGNFQALHAVLSDIARLRVDRVVSLGDNVGYGPEPEEVVQTLLDHRVVSVMGNHELGLVSDSYRQRLHVHARTSLDRTRSLLSPASLKWLQTLPAFCLEAGARLVHGCPPQSITVYLHAPTDNRLRRLFASYPESMCFAGHTHNVACYADCDGIVLNRPLRLAQFPLDPQARYLLLPGSVGQPRDTLNWHAKYLLWDQEACTVELRAVPYDVQTTIRLLGERGFPAVNAKRLLW